MADLAGTSSAKRRRERRLRAMLRRERQTVATELAAALHHSRDRGRVTNYGLRAPKTASSGRRHGVLTEPEPQGQERIRNFPRRSQVAPEPKPLVHLGVGEVHDGPLVSFLLQRALLERRKEEELEVLQRKRHELVALLDVPRQRRTPDQQSRVQALTREVYASKRKRKKRRKRRHPRTSSLSSPRRRFRQWHLQGSFSWFRSHAVSPSFFRQA